MSVEANISRNISLWRAYHRKYAPVNGVSVLSDEINRIVEHDFMTLNVPIVLGWQKKNSKIRWEGGFVIHHLLKNDTYDEKFIIEYVDVVYTWDPVGSELVELDPPRQFTRLGSPMEKTTRYGLVLGVDWELINDDQIIIKPEARIGADVVRFDTRFNLWGQIGFEIYFVK